jgi:hypothetical protein
MLNVLGDIKHVFNACDIFRRVPHKVVMAKFMKGTPSVSTSGQQQRSFSFTQTVIALSVLQRWLET